MGSMWANSDLYGPFEDYLIQDVIAFVEGNFRALPQKEFRFVTGWSMGGMGSANAASRYPDMFRGCIPCIAGLSMPDTCMNGWRSGCYLENGSYNLSYTGGGFMTQVLFTLCGAYSPNMSNPPYFVDIPFDTLGNWNSAVVEKWYTYDVSRRVKDLPGEDELAWFVICGTQDELYGYPACLAFTDTLDFYGIAHDESYFEGGHVFDAQSWITAIHWLDSIIDDEYASLTDVMEFMDHVRVSFNAFPNPCCNVFNVRAELPGPDEVTIVLWDQSGRRIKELDKRSIQGGTYSAAFDVSGLPTGIYYCTLKSGNQTSTQKVVKVE
jgi:hypothetical protein